MSASRLIRELAAALNPPEAHRFVVVDRDGTALRTFVGCEQATRFNTDTPEASQVFRLSDGKPMTQPKTWRQTDAQLEAVFKRAEARFSADAETLDTDEDEDDELDETEAA